jgi:hypothetical protein
MRQSMRQSPRHRIPLYAAGLAAALLATPCVAQKVDFGKYPDFHGQWTRGVGNPNNWRQEAGPAPLTPKFEKVFADITADLKAGGPGNWPSTFCIPAGMPAIMSFYDPMEMIVMPDVTYILVSHNDDQIRRIYTDGRDWPKDTEPTFAGYSIGHWVDENGDGKYNVLEIETRFLKDPRGYDTSGLPFANDGKTRIKERIYLDRNDKNTLYDEIMVYDNAMTRPYGKVQKAVRNPNPRPAWHSDVCSENNTWVQIGGQDYYVSADGKLMPSKKGQQPPDLTYFQETKK